MEQTILETIGKFISLAFEFPVWPFVFVINFTSLVYHFSPIAKYHWVKNNRALLVFLTASIGAIALGVREFLRHDFQFTDNDLLYQARLISSWAVAVVIYHIGGFKSGVRKIKETIKK